MNRKERVFTVLDGKCADRVPTAFWMHFPPDAFYGQEAVDVHLDYFARTRTDICKIMTEYTYPCLHDIQSAADWHQVKCYRADAPFIRKQAEIVRAVTSRCEDAATVATIHGVVASASHALLGIPKYDLIGRFAQLYHLRTNPGAVTDAYRRIAETLCEMVRETLAAGADGIYYAALGGERDGFTDEEHAKYIAPMDRLVIEEAYRAGAKFVILHMCKPKVNLKRFVGYPCDVINWGVEESGTTLQEGRALFPGKVVLGGLNNHHGPLVSGPLSQLEAEVHRIIRENGSRGLILGSDCTLPGDLPYERIAAVADACQSYEEKSRIYG